MLQGRGVRALWGTGVLLTAVWACETARNPGGIQRDLTPPTISLTKAAPDTQDISAGLTFSVSATDNLGLKDIRLTYTGGYLALTDTVFFSTLTAATIPVHITFPSGSGAGGLIRIVGRATDGAAGGALRVVTRRGGRLQHGARDRPERHQQDRVHRHGPRRHRAGRGLRGCAAPAAP